MICWWPWNDIGYKHNKNVKYGFHDQSIFLFDKIHLLEQLDVLINKNEYDELRLLDVVKYFDKIKYFETSYQVKSFNTMQELHD